MRTTALLLERWPGTSKLRVFEDFCTAERRITFCALTCRIGARLHDETRPPADRSIPGTRREQALERTAVSAVVDYFFALALIAAQRAF